MRMWPWMLGGLNNDTNDKNAKTVNSSESIINQSVQHQRCNENSSQSTDVKSRK